jgi:U-box domain
MEIMKDPVVVENGDSYERKAIEEWFKNHNTLPLTRDQVTNKSLFPNRALKIYIDWWLAQNPQPVPTYFDDNPPPIRQKPIPQSSQFLGILSAVQRVLSRRESEFANVTEVEFTLSGGSSTPRAQSPPAIPWASINRVIPI